MDPFIIIDKYYQNLPVARKILINHSSAVAEKAVMIAKMLKLEDRKVQFIYEAAMLHDIGIFLTDASDIGCYGQHPYICHGYLGHDLLLKEGYPDHAKVCERHTGAGISKEEIVSGNLPIPNRSMLPKTLAEEIITYADKFFSKDPNSQKNERSVKKIRENLSKHGPDKVDKFNEWHQSFKVS
ncbi:MAG: HD domain-containing protein [Bacteroidales bacterium]|nr:HD domain-containing protein [Bacteroidales bacterium]